jgi:hypothetical protein
LHCFFFTLTEHMALTFTVIGSSAWGWGIWLKLWYSKRSFPNILGKIYTTLYYILHIRYIYVIHKWLAYSTVIYTRLHMYIMLIVPKQIFKYLRKYWYNSESVLQIIDRIVKKACSKYNHARPNIVWDQMIRRRFSSYTFEWSHS